ncbi:beta-phosphoglucomutase [Ohessyouella blattaphilus]|uniref:Beta-phosphoglucomutase n=1 Tax=Ohessyouella blattaphilus TaxID=2949333 RepID=A0ABT1EFU1_9FIRM|nr:beta-phosphoglucomutase [Ohessyouella blattaphilus]MCP1109559.1 beta-phosphoglucomutase [Ohessyouella blattaphilus]MCR8562953.1 beta-phosphoglucomutase [Ohessyouella blattaphilus]
MDERVIKVEGFKIVEDQYTQDRTKFYEGILAQGNGYFHVRGNFEEGLVDAPQDEIYTRTMKSVTTEVQRHPLSKAGTFLPLVMGEHPFLGEVIVNLPFFMSIKITADNEKLDMSHCEIRNYRRVLDMKTGEMSRSFSWVTAKGSVLKVMFSRFASLKDKHVFAQKVILEPEKGNPCIRIESSIDGAVTTNGYYHFTEIESAITDGVMEMNLKTDMSEHVSIMSKHSIQAKEAVCLETSSNKVISTVYDMILQERTELVKYTSLGCSRDKCEDYVKDVKTSLVEATQYTYEELLAASSNIWKERWTDADIRIRGCRKLQEGIRFSIYHLLRCSAKVEDRIQICAKGFAGEAYYGRYFWDTEMYMLPFYLHTDPLSARSLVGYRYNTLAGAKENAMRYNSRGARYPWHSGVTGTEQCSLWEYADNEVHINADVPFGILHYYHATGDEKFLFDKGIDVLLETAKFWIDRVDMDEKGIYHLLNVMGPDEYSPMTKDNGYTNYMVKYNLKALFEVLEIMKKKCTERYDELMEQTKTSASELKVLKEIAESLPVPYDKARDLYLQSADFEEYSIIDIEGIWKNKDRAFGHYVTQEKLYRSRCIKQADTIALMSIFPEEFTNYQVLTAYEYYKPFTTHDSSLSPAIYALAAHRLRLEKDTEELLNRALGVDMEFARKGAEDGIHIANCGAIWQIVVQGFMGMMPMNRSGKPIFRPQLPSFIEAIEATVIWRGKKYHVCVEGEQYKAQVIPSTMKGFLFDLDGVLTDTAEYHYLAWKQLADNLGLSFDRTINERLKGVSRRQSFEIILAENQAENHFSDKEINEQMELKNDYYKNLINQITPQDILPGILDFLKEAKAQNILLAVASASANAKTVLDGLGISSMFDYIADARKIKYTKPNPEVFTNCMEFLELEPWECVAFEDAAAGIQAIRSAGVTSVGIGESAKLEDPDIYLESTEMLTVAIIKELM